MNNDTNPLQERLWEAVAEVRDQHPRVFNDAPTDDVIDAVLPILRAAQADAWDEGFEVGESNGYAIGRDIDTDENTENPYREQED